MGRFSTEFFAASREAVGEGPETKTWARTAGARRRGSRSNGAERAVVVMARPGLKVEGDSTAGGGGARKKSARKRSGHVVVQPFRLLLQAESLHHKRSGGGLGRPSPWFAARVRRDVEAHALLAEVEDALLRGRGGSGRGGRVWGY